MSRTPSEDDPLPTPEVTRGSVADKPHPPESDNSAALLAELDVLLERMMALPVNELDEERPPERQPEKPPEHLPVVTVSEAIPESPLPSSAPPADDLYVQSILHPQIEELPYSRPPEPVAVFHSAEPELPVLDAASSPDLPVAPPVRKPVSDPKPIVEPEYSVWSLPARLCNDGYDRVTGFLGAPGRWLQGPSGRTLIGLAGLLMLLVVAGLALHDCLDWTQ